MFTVIFFTQLLVIKLWFLVNFGLVWFGLVSLFSGIKTSVDNLMLKLSRQKKNSIVTIQTTARSSDKEFIPFPRVLVTGILTWLLRCHSLVRLRYLGIYNTVREKNIVVSLLGDLWAELPTMWQFQRLYLPVFGSRHRPERNPFLSSTLFEKHMRANSLLRIFPTTGNPKCLTVAIRHFLIFGTAFVTFL